MSNFSFNASEFFEPFIWEESNDYYLAWKNGALDIEEAVRLISINYP